jgi:hypothetical protein
MAVPQYWLAGDKNSANPGGHISAANLNRAGFNNLFVHQQATADNTLAVDSGVYSIFGKVVKYAGGNTPTIAKPTTNPRIDLITIDQSGTVAVTTGTENASPTVPTYPRDKYVLAEVYIRTTANPTIVIKQGDDSTNSYILRDCRAQGVFGIGGIELTADGTFTAGEPAQIMQSGKVAKGIGPRTRANSNAGTSTNCSRNQIIKLDTDKVVMATVTWSAGSGTCYLVCGTVDSSDVWTWGSVQSFAFTYNTSYLAHPALDVLSTTHFVIGVNSDTRVCSVATRTITVGAASSVGGQKHAVRALTSSLVVRVYYDGTNTVVRAASVSGTTLTFGSAVTLKAGDGLLQGVCPLTATTGLATYQISTTLYGRLFSISGTTVTLDGSETTIASSCDTTMLHTTRTAHELSSTAVIVPYQKTNTMKVAYCTISGTTLTIDTTYNIAMDFGGTVTLAAPSTCYNTTNNEVVMSFAELSNSNILYQTIQWDATNKLQFGRMISIPFANLTDAPTDGQVQAAWLDNHRYAVTYTKSGGNFQGAIQYLYQWNVIGIFANSGTDGQTSTVVTAGVWPGLSSLDAGERYYSGIDGALTKTRTFGDPQVGIAISTTEMLVLPAAASEDWRPVAYGMARATGSNPGTSLIIPVDCIRMKIWGSLAASTSWDFDVEWDLRERRTLIISNPLDNTSSTYSITFTISGQTVTITSTTPASATLVLNFSFYTA